MISTTCYSNVSVRQPKAENPFLDLNELQVLVRKNDPIAVKNFLDEDLDLFNDKHSAAVEEALKLLPDTRKVPGGLSWSDTLRYPTNWENVQSHLNNFLRIAKL